MTRDFSFVRGKKRALRVEGYLELRMPEHALAEIRKANQDPDYFDPHLFYMEGEALRQMKRYRDALYPLGQAVLLEPRDVKLWLLIGHCQKRIGRCDLAIESLENALYLEPNSPIVHYTLACNFALANRVTDCLKSLTRALILDENFRKYASLESDFDGLRHMPEFTEIIADPEQNH